MSNKNDGIDREVYDDATAAEILRAREWDAEVDGALLLVEGEEHTPPRKKPVRVIHPPPPEQEEFWDPPPSDSDSDSASASASASASEPGTSKKVRGKTTGRAFQKRLEANKGNPLPVEWSVLNVPTKATNRPIVNEISMWIRDHAPVWHNRWDYVDKKVQQLLLDHLKTKFVLDYSNERDVEFVGQKMVSGYRTFKRLLKMHYETFNTYEEAKNNPPHTDLWNRRPIVQWHWLCDNVYNDPTHMEISKKNSENRRRLRNLHCGGSRSYGLHTINEAEEGRPLSIIDTWGKLHRTKDGGWISKDALDHVQKMDNDRHGMKMKLAAEAGGDIAPETIVLPIESEFQILRKELGYKGRKIIGVGAYPLMEARLSIATSAHANKNKIKDLEEENERLRSQIETLKASSSRGRMSSSRGRMLKASSSRGRILKASSSRGRRRRSQA